MVEMLVALLSHSAINREISMFLLWKAACDWAEQLLVVLAAGETCCSDILSHVSRIPADDCHSTTPTLPAGYETSRLP
jgi:hypothetical protein